MKNAFVKILSSLSLLFATPAFSSDQLFTLFGSNGYILYKTLDFAQDHGFAYIKILSYRFEGFDHLIEGTCQEKDDKDEGLYLELKDGKSFICLRCYKQKPESSSVIEVSKYRFLLDHIHQ